MVVLVVHNLAIVLCAVSVVRSLPLPDSIQDDRFWRIGRDLDQMDYEDSEICAVFDLPLNSSIGSLLDQTTAIFKFPTLNSSIWHISQLMEFKNKFHKAGFHSAAFIVVHGDNINSEAQLINNVTFVPDIDNPLFEAMQNNSVAVIDRCENVVYQIFPPWSSLHLPYVKAAILSTMFDLPCGPCDRDFDDIPHPLYQQFQDNSAEEKGKEKVFYDMERNPELRQSFDFNGTTPATDLNETDEIVIPMRIILPVEHIHEMDPTTSTFTKYNYIVLRTDNDSYHGHLNTDEGETLKVQNDLNTSTEPPLFQMEDSDEDKPLFLSFSNNNSIERSLKHDGKNEDLNDLILRDTANYLYKIRKSYKTEATDENRLQEFKEIEPVLNNVIDFVTEIASAANNGNITQGIDEHYSNMLPWLDYFF